MPTETPFPKDSDLVVSFISLKDLLGASYAAYMPPAPPTPWVSVGGGLSAALASKREFFRKGILPRNSQSYALVKSIFEGTRAERNLIMVPADAESAEWEARVRRDHESREADAVAHHKERVARHFWSAEQLELRRAVIRDKSRTFIETPGEKKAKAALSKIMEVTGQTTKRPYTTLSQIHMLAREGLV
jgi:hypothetical protein